MGYISPINVQIKSNEQITIRVAMGPDGKQMHQLTKEVLQEEEGLIMTLSDFTMTEEEQMKKNDWFIQHPDTLAIIAIQNNEVIGILTIEPEIFMKTCHRGILGLIVKKEYRSKGVGRALMTSALYWVSYQSGYEKIELEVLESNLAAIALYNNLGFQKEGIRHYAIKNNVDNYDHLVQMGIFTQQIIV